MEPFVRNPYNYDMNAAGNESGLKCLDLSLTKQSFLEETDINTIVNRFHLTGELPTNIRMPTYGDFTGVHDFHTAMNAVAVARESFDAMPADIRARFHNSAEEFVDFCSDDANIPEARKMGLVPAAEVVQAAALINTPQPPAPAAEAAPGPSGAPASKGTE